MVIWAWMGKVFGAKIFKSEESNRDERVGKDEAVSVMPQKNADTALFKSGSYLPLSPVPH